MPPMDTRIVISVDPATESALEHLAPHYGLTRSALVRLAIRRLAEAHGWEPVWEMPDRQPRTPKRTETPEGELAATA